MKSLLKERIAQNIAAATGLELERLLPCIEKPKVDSHGDLAFPCFILAKEKGLPPPQCASWLAEELTLPEGIKSLSATGPFLNFRFDPSYLASHVLQDTLQCAPPSAQNKKVVVEYSSPNIAKPFHVGHLRATLIGNCLDRVYRSLGYEVVSVNHLGDWGTQFGFVWAGCRIWGMPETFTVGSLVDLYRQATSLREAQEKGEVSAEDEAREDVNEMARAYFIALEEGEKEATAFWQRCVDTSLEYLKKTYKRLSIQFDHYTGESFYSDKLAAVEQDLKDAGLLEESQGALGVELGEKLGFARIATPDGRSLYLTRDLACVKYRAGTFAFDKALYVVGAPQQLHFKQLKAILERLKLPYADRLEHIAFGHVMGMKTRGEGGFIELNEFIDEAIERARAAYQAQVQKRPEGLDEDLVCTGVALAALMFSTLSRSNLKDVHFSWDHALAFQGDSGPYILYAYARINGMKEKAQAAGFRPSLECKAELLEEDSAHRLISLLADYGEVLERTASENEPSVLAAYALELAKAVSRAYLELKVVGEEKELAESRLTLFEASRKTLGRCLELLGMSVLERM